MPYKMTPKQAGKLAEARALNKMRIRLDALRAEKHAASERYEEFSRKYWAAYEKFHGVKQRDD